MSERLSSNYQQLFQVHVLHHYWLDEGATLFDDIVAAAKANRLLNYDVRRFLTITPTPITAKSLLGLKCIYKNTALGFVVIAPSDTKIPMDLQLEFIVTVNHSDFYNYTALTLRSQPITEHYYKIEDKIYRYKENVPLLSNLTGISRGINPNETLYLSQAIPAVADNKIESFVLSGNVLDQLISEQPVTTKRISSQANSIPVFVHQGDIPTINPPIGLTGVPSEGIFLTEDISDSLFALVRIKAVRTDNDAFSFVNNLGNAKPTPPIFQIRFKNRSTVWSYLSKSTGAILSEELTPLPLTYFGNAGSQTKPSEGLVKPDKSGTKITRLISEIFV